MGFRKICCTELEPHLHPKNQECMEPHPNIGAYRFLARMAGVAACQEIYELEKK
jgi:hypothetical protein